MLRLGDGGAHAIRSTEGTDKGEVMSKGMLTRKVESFRPDTGFLEYSAESMESIECILKFSKRFGILNIASSDITKF
jgi:hypothetical protein